MLFLSLSPPKHVASNSKIQVVYDVQPINKNSVTNDNDLYGQYTV